jgi:hypothetical protein
LRRPETDFDRLPTNSGMDVPIPPAGRSANRIACGFGAELLWT